MRINIILFVCINYFTMAQYSQQISFQNNHNKLQDSSRKNEPIQKKNYNLMRSNHTQAQQTSDNNKKFLQWLKMLNVSERSEKFTYTNKSFTLLILQMVYRKKIDSQKSFIITKETQTNTLILYGKETTNVTKKKNQLETQNELIKNVLIISKQQLCDSITLNERILGNIQKLFQIFDSLEEDNSYQMTNQQYKLLEKERDDIFYTRQNNVLRARSIGQWLVKVFKQQIWLEYYNQLYEIEQQKKYKQKKRLNKIWKELSFEKKIELITIPSYLELSQIIFKEKSDENIHYSSLFKIDIPTESEINQYTKSLNLPHQIDIFQYLTEYSILQASQKLTCIKWVIFMGLRKLLNDNRESKNKKKNKMKYNKKRKTLKPEKSQKVQISQQNQNTKKYQIVEKDFLDYKKNPEKSSPKLLKSTQKQFLQNERLNRTGRQDKEIKDNFKRDFRSNESKVKIKQTTEKYKKTKKYVEIQQYQEKSLQTIQDIQRNSKSVTSNQTNQTNFFHHDQNQSLSLQQIQNKKKLIQKIYQQKLKSDIVGTADFISEIANSYSTYRIIAYNRINYLIKNWGVPIKVFGSCATGLALASSDIDLAVDSSILNYFYYSYGTNRDKVCAALTSIYQLLQKRSWLNNLRLILTANIPVLKFEINTQAQFDQSPKDPTLNLVKQKQKNKKIIIKVDLTIEYFNTIHEQSNHLGVMATTCMNQWMKQYPSLHTISIIIKYLLKKKQLNNVYKGGLSTYCIMIMIIAYLQIKKLKEQKDCSKVFYGFLYYYTVEFNNEQFGIDISNRNDPLFILETVQSSKIQVKDPLNGKIISLNSYQYQKILQQFNSLRAFRDKIQKEMNSYLLNPQIKLTQKHKYFPKNLLQEYLNGI